MPETQATPRPWRSGDRLPWMICGDVEVIAHTISQRAAAAFVDDPERLRGITNAVLIVTAVNEYDALRAVEAAARTMLKAHPDTPDGLGIEVAAALVRLDALRGKADA